jgi:uncharacterized repeat protein (TIGR03843 family)
MARRPPAPEAPRPISLQDMLTLLQEGQLELRGLLPEGSNYTFLVMVGDGVQKTLAVYKPTQGERPLWDFPAETLALREVAAFLVSEVLGWNFVPPTVYRTDGPHGPGSVQFFIHAQPDTHYFNLAESDHPDLRRIALFDVLINNADRKGGHVLKDESGKLWAIDHGICFHAQPKLRTVIWDFAGQSIPSTLLDDVSELRQRLDKDKDLKTAINSLLAPVEVSALRRRADKLIASGCYPDPGPGRNYPWPPL